MTHEIDPFDPINYLDADDPLSSAFQALEASVAARETSRVQSAREGARAEVVARCLASNHDGAPVIISIAGHRQCATCGHRLPPNPIYVRDKRPSLAMRFQLAFGEGIEGDRGSVRAFYEPMNDEMVFVGHLHDKPRNAVRSVRVRTHRAALVATTRGASEIEFVEGTIGDVLMSVRDGTARGELWHALFQSAFAAALKRLAW